MCNDNRKDIIESLYLLCSKEEGTKTNMFIKIVPGSGGDDCCELAQQIYKIYLNFLSKHFQAFISDMKSNLQIKILKRSLYDFLRRTEDTTYKIIRISPFSKKRETSYVRVCPVESESVNITINEEEVEFKPMKSSGPGGQHVNKTLSAVRATYRGTTVAACNRKSQTQNKKSAILALRKNMEEKASKGIEESKLKNYKESDKIAWGNYSRIISLHGELFVKTRNEKKIKISCMKDIDILKIIEEESF